MGWYSEAVVYGLIGCQSLFLSIALPTFLIIIIIILMYSIIEQIFTDVLNY